MKKITYEVLKKQIHYTKKNLGKSSMTSGDEYLVTLEHKGKKMKFHFHDNQANNSKLDDMLRCLVFDRSSALCSGNFLDWVSMFGGDGDKASLKQVYKTIKANNKGLASIFTRTELDVLDYAMEE